MKLEFTEQELQLLAFCISTAMRSGDLSTLNALNQANDMLQAKAKAALEVEQTPTEPQKE